MPWTQLEADDPRKWTTGESVEGTLAVLPDALTAGGFIALTTPEGQVVKYCPSRLWGLLASVPIGTPVRIYCEGKLKEKGSAATWSFKVMADLPEDAK